ncbi:MAG: hypothetical protein EXR91_12345 [Gemmatimonadetes bacterium]|nr:hypothetical protein [Gemmatimonadota bacterium]
MDASTSALEADDRANDLYWGSDLSVNQIADALDLSKGALYEMIRPLPSSVACPRCATEAEHPNRTAKERGLVACPWCGWGGTEADAAEAPVPGGQAVPRAPFPIAAHPTARAPRTLAGGVLLGAAVGLALVLWARRRA